MDIIFFTHPSFTYSQSMPRYTQWLMDGMRQRGHSVRLLKPEPFFFKLPLPGVIKKWMGYIDQFIIFPARVRKIIAREHKDTLYVITDHALGPWVPLIAGKKHIVHCHDFLAQRSALGQIEEAKTGSTGRIYQKYIRNGYRKGENFISVSQQTQNDLHELLNHVPRLSEVVYNGLTQVFTPVDDVAGVRAGLQEETAIQLSAGYLLHVGGNQWYKNRGGVLEIYNAWRKTSLLRLPLLMIGEEPTPDVQSIFEASPFKNDIYFLKGKNDQFVKRAYAAAALFVFPSFAEGFGWPIIEAMASGCPVITTNCAPMTEVGGNAAIYIPRKSALPDEAEAWASNAAQEIEDFFADQSGNTKRLNQLGMNNIRRFNSDVALDKIEAIYQKL